METITFKIDRKFAGELDRHVKRIGQRLTRNTYARKLVIDCLTDEERNTLQKDITNMHQEVASLREEIQELRHDFATAVIALLTQGGKIENLDEAEEWVHENLL